jgi:non-specific serine/threonine protein kinase
MELDEALALLDVAEAARKALRGPEAEAAHAHLEARHPDLVHAFEWLLLNDHVDEALRLASAMVPFWMATKRIDEGDGWFDRAHGVRGGSDSSRARALHDHGYLAFWAGEYERSGDLSRQAVAAGRAAEEPTVVALALAVLARVALNTDVEEAKRLLLEALAVTEGTDDREGRSSAMHVLGVAYQMNGEFEAAARMMSERIALGRETGNDFLVAVESANLSMVKRQLGNLAAAEDLSRTALATFHRLGEALATAWSANGLAAVTAAKGDLERAATLLGFAEAAIEAAGSEWPADERAQYEATLKLLDGAPRQDAIARARVAGRALSTSEAISFALGSPNAVLRA